MAATIVLAAGSAGGSSDGRAARTSTASRLRWTSFAAAPVGARNRRCVARWTGPVRCSRRTRRSPPAVIASGLHLDEYGAAEMIVIGARQRHLLDRVLHGHSTSEDLIQHSHVPVVIVPPDPVGR